MEKEDQFTDEWARKVQNFGEEHPDFHSPEMDEWRRKQNGNPDECTNDHGNNIAVHIGIGYGGAIKVRATVDGVDFLIEKAEAERILEWVIKDGKTLKTQTKRMIRV